MNRSELINGPAKFELEYGSSQSESWYITDGQAVELKPTITLREQRLNGMEIDKFVDDVVIELDCPVDNRLDAGRVAILWPYASSLPGTGIWTDTDRALKIHDVAGRLYTVKAAAVTKMPDLNFGIDGPLIGNVGITGLRGNGLAWTAANSMMSIAATGGSFAEAALTSASFLNQAYLVTLGTDFVDAETTDGVKVKFNLELVTLKTQSVGTIQKFIKSVTVAAEFTPAGAAYDKVLTLMKMQGSGAARGRSLDTGSLAFSVKGITTNRVHFSLSKGAVHQGSYRFGVQENVLRDGAVAVVSTRQFTSGVMDALFTITP